MKTNEFARKIQSLGLTVETEQMPDLTYISVNSPAGSALCQLSSKDTSWFDVDVTELGHDLNERAKKMIAPIVNEYLATPVDEREPKKKYRLIWQEDGIAGPWVMGYNSASENWEVDDESSLVVRHYQTRFTDAGLEEIANGNEKMLNRLNALKEEAKDNED